MGLRWLGLAVILVAGLVPPAWAQDSEALIRCESNDGRYHFCSTVPITGARLQRQVSGSPCEQDRTWGYRNDGLWVDKGCRAEFELIRAEVAQVVRCDSNDGGFHLCETGPLRRAELARQISGSPCRENYSWGTRPEGLWVHHGCRAEFRTWSATDHRPPADIVRCESNDGRYHFCSTGPIRHAELNRQISGSPCRESESWGQRADGIWVDKGCRGEFEVRERRRLIPRTIRCNSDDEGYHLCSTGPIERAEMNRQISGTPCREGTSWGARHDGVWVDRGCRAEFTVYAFEGAQGSVATRNIRCDSSDELYHFCPTGPISRAELAVQVSGSECRYNHTWGYKPDGIWVDKGCRAEFALFE
jgi:hypothetical protein